MLQKGSALTTTVGRVSLWRCVVFVVVFAFSISVGCLGIAQAQSSDTVLGTNVVNKVAAQSGVRSTDLYSLIGRIINIALGLVGVVLLGYLLFAGYLWMTSGGEMEKAERAQTMIRNAVIGLLIIVASFAIVNFILSQLAQVAGFGGSRDDGPAISPITFPSAAGALGGGIIEYHLPARDATGVPRNTSIIITFKEPIQLASLIQGYDDGGTPEDLTDDRPTTDLNTGTMRVIRRAVGGGSDQTLNGNQVQIRFTEDRKTFVIRPNEWLGSPTVNTPYRIELSPGRSGLLLEDGNPAFGSSSPSGYAWEFEVSTLVDLTPPRITSVVPLRGVHAPNTVIQVNFNEAIDPTSVAGVYRSGRGFSNLEVSSALLGATGASTRVEGEFRISNRYTTVEFTTFDMCGRNACGREIYCLPRSSSVDVLVKAAHLSESPPQARIVSAGAGTIFDGVVDVASNSLDGNADGTAQGPDADNARWAFSTGAEPDLTAPRIQETSPVIGPDPYPAGSSRIPVDQIPNATFGGGGASPSASILQASTVNTDNVYITRQNEPPETTGDTFWWVAYQSLLGSRGEPATGADAVRGRVSIGHRSYVPVPATVAGSSPPIAPVYSPVLTSGLQNILQNCFKPSGSASCSASSSEPFCCDGVPSRTACSYSSRPSP